MASSSSSYYSSTDDPEILKDLIDDDDLQNNEITGKALVGKIKTSRTCNSKAVIDIITKAWKQYAIFHITECGQNMFLFNFQQAEQAMKIMNMAPWFVMNHLLCLEEWHPSVAYKEIPFDKSPFWIQIHNLPLANLKTSFAERLLNKVGNVVKVENPVCEGLLLRSFIRGRVIMDLAKPFPTGCLISRNNLPKIWVVYRYERLQSLCYKCGMIGHDQHFCDKMTVMATFDKSVPRYNHNIAVNVPRSLQALARYAGIQQQANNRRAQEGDAHNEALNKHYQATAKLVHAEGIFNSTGNNAAMGDPPGLKALDLHAIEETVFIRDNHIHWQRYSPNARNDRDRRMMERLGMSMPISEDIERNLVEQGVKLYMAPIFPTIKPVISPEVLAAPAGTAYSEEDKWNKDVGQNTGKNVQQGGYTVQLPNEELFGDNDMVNETQQMIDYDLSNNMESSLFLKRKLITTGQDQESQHHAEPARKNQRQICPFDVDEGATSALVESRRFGTFNIGYYSKKAEEASPSKPPRAK